MCLRCHRMKKQCQPSPPMRRPRTLKRFQGNETSNSKLEEKLDGLVTLLKSATQGGPGILNATLSHSPLNGLVPISQVSPSGIMPTSDIQYGEHAQNLSLSNRDGAHGSNYASTASPSTSTPPTSIVLQTSIISALEPNPEEAESYLNTFRTKFVRHLPFVVIPPSISAQQLRQERPLLWISIMTVATDKSTQQTALSNEMRSLLSREAFVEGTRNMDILLATLVYATW